MERANLNPNLDCNLPDLYLAPPL